jgi:hypothetical protein
VIATMASSLAKFTDASSKLLTTESLQKAIDELKNDLQSWDALIAFPVVLPVLPGMPATLSYCNNLLEYTKSKYKGQKVYFCQSKYPLHDGWEVLKNDLESAALEQGSAIISNGGGTGKARNSKKLICKCGRVYQRGLTDKDKVKTFRNGSLHSDRKNSRGPNGKRMPRRTSSMRPDNANSVCRMSFTIKWDKNGYYLYCGYGNIKHTNHVKLAGKHMTFPKRLVADAERDVVESIGAAKALHAVARNVHFQRTGRLLSHSQVRYMHNMAEKITMALSVDGSSINIDALSDSERMFEHFKLHGVNYSLLYNHVPTELASNSTSTSCQATVDNNSLTSCLLGMTDGESVSLTSPSSLVSETHNVNDWLGSSTAVKLPPKENEDMLRFANEHRDSYKLENSQKLMIGCAWIHPKEKRLFQLFPEVVHVDSTADTNKEGRPLLTMTGRDSSGKHFTILRVFLPNERAFVFRWLFRLVLPSLLGTKWTKRIKVIITDGDSQETSQLDIAIALLFPDVLRVRCGWHIVDRGWKRKCPGYQLVDVCNRNKFEVVTKIIKSWLYSWMQPWQCETEKEYNISKSLLFAYMQSLEVVSVMGQQNASRIFQFIRENVEPHESHYCFHKLHH